MLNSVALLFTLCVWFLFISRVPPKSTRILEILAQDSKWCRDQDVREDHLRINNMATDQALTRFKSRRNGHRLHVKNLEKEVNVTLDAEFEETSRPELDPLKQKLTMQLTKIETLDNEIINAVTKWPAAGQYSEKTK